MSAREVGSLMATPPPLRRSLFPHPECPAATDPSSKWLFAAVRPCRAHASEPLPLASCSLGGDADPLWGAGGQSVPNQIDMSAQVIEPVGEIQRDAQAPDMAIDPLDLGLLGSGIGLAAGAVEAALQRLQLPVPVKQAPAHIPGVDDG